MACPRCGGELSSAGRCPHCSASITSAAATIGVLTPVPAGRPIGMVDSGAAFDDNAPTLMPGSPIRDDNAPTLMSGSPTRDDNAPTLMPGSPIRGDNAPTLMPGSPIRDQELSVNEAADAASADTGPLTTGQSFGPRYHIIRPLGVGGMGAVYQAWDAELGVAVAIKVIRPEVMSDSGTASEVERRFKQELLLARQVTHRNVVRIHDLGEIDRIKYITMPYVDGSDLATVLKREGKLPVPRVLRVARAIVAGLVAAHKAGVVHRDLKPANIMIDAEDEAVIMDFGIARSTGGAATMGMRPSVGQLTPGPAPSRANVTAVGTIVGTVAYMAPEQAKGEPADQRADVYAMGLMLYDMLLGPRRVEHSDSPIAELKARMQQSPPTARSVMPEIPEALDALVTRCLHPDPAARYQTTEDLAADLDRLDENGEPIPIRRVVGLPLVSAVVVVLLMLSAGTWWYSRTLLPPPPHDPVSVLIADFQNGTSDPTFDRTLEPTLKLALEGAGFVSAYDRSVISSRLGVRPPDKLDEVAARELAVKQGLGVVVSGSLERQASGYELSLKAAQAVTGNVITSVKSRASNKDQVLAVATRLATSVRKALGDNTSDSAQRFAMETLSATSLEVVHEYAVAMEAVSNSKFDEARRSFSKAVDLDPNFGLAHAGMAMMSKNLGQQQEAEKYATEANTHLDGMTERERYRTRGIYFYVTGDYQACAKEYGDLIARYAADATAQNNLALCLTYLRKMPDAVAGMRRAIAILPKRALYRLNLAVYAAYGDDFQTAEREARTAQELGNPKGPVALAFAQLLQDQLPQVTETYQKLATVDELGASRAASGLGDLAIYEGRFLDAVRILGEGAAADVTSKQSDRAAAKFAALAYARVLEKQKGAATAAAENALKNSQAVKIRFLAARMLVETGEIAKARTLAAGLASELQAEPQALAKIIDGDLALKNGDPRQAIKALNEANGLLDTWIGHFDLGRAYLEAGLFTQADSQFDACIQRRGEALALFLDEEPTYGYLPLAYYYQGRVREGLKTGFADSYRRYLTIRGKAGEDPLLPEVRRSIPKS